MCEDQGYIELTGGSRFRILHRAGVDENGPYNLQTLTRKGITFKVSWGIRLHCPKCNASYIVESPPTPEGFKAAFNAAGGKGDPGPVRLD